MTIPELYELFIHNPKVTTDSRNCCLLYTSDAADEL